MKITRVNQLRSVVTSENEWGEGRGNLYAFPRRGTEGLQLETQVINRVRQANRLYNVFFSSDIPRDLEEHFKRVVSLTAKARRDKLSGKLENYAGYDFRGSWKSVYEFSYKVSGKKIWKAL